MKRIIIITAVLALTMPLFAAFDYMPGNVLTKTLCGNTSAWAGGMDNISVNPASITGVRNIDISVAYENLYFFAHTFAAAAAYRSSFGAIGIKYSEFITLGDYADADSIISSNTRLHNEKVAQLTYGLSLDEYISVGANVNVLYLWQLGFGDNIYYTVDLGASGRIYDRWVLGISVANITASYINGVMENYRYYMDRSISAGLSYEPYEGVTTMFNVSKSAGYPTSFGFGTVYELLKDRFMITAGVKSYPMQYGAGFRVKVSKFSVDYGYTAAAALSSNHHIQLNYSF